MNWNSVMRNGPKLEGLTTCCGPTRTARGMAFTRPTSLWAGPQGRHPQDIKSAHGHGKQSAGCDAAGDEPTAAVWWEGAHGELHHCETRLPGKVSRATWHRKVTTAERGSLPVALAMARLRRPTARVGSGSRSSCTTRGALGRHKHTGMATGLSRRGSSLKGENPRQRDGDAAALRWTAGGVDRLYGCSEEKRCSWTCQGRKKVAGEGGRRQPRWGENRGRRWRLTSIDHGSARWWTCATLYRGAKGPKWRLEGLHMGALGVASGARACREGWSGTGRWRAVGSCHVQQTRMGQLGAGPCLLVVVRATWRRCPAAAATWQQARDKSRGAGSLLDARWWLKPRCCTWQVAAAAMRQRALQCLSPRSSARAS
jgi:hypothetical protein